MIDTFPQIAVVVGGFLNVAAGGIVLAQAQPQAPDTIGSGALMGGAGLILALTGFLKGFWDDRKDSRQVDLEKYRLARSVDTQAIESLYDWAQAVTRTNPKLPAAPRFPADEQNAGQDTHSRTSLNPVQQTGRGQDV